MPRYPLHIRAGHDRGPYSIIEISSIEGSAGFSDGKTYLDRCHESKLRKIDLASSFKCTYCSHPALVVGKVRRPPSMSTSFHCSRNCSDCLMPVRIANRAQGKAQVCEDVR